MSSRRGTKSNGNKYNNNDAKSKLPAHQNPPNHPQEDFPQHRTFLARSLNRNDADMAALVDLNRTLHVVRDNITSACGEEILLDLGEGLIQLTPCERDLMMAPLPAELAYEHLQEDDEVVRKFKQQRAEVEERLEGLEEEHRVLCVDFLLRMKLRRRLLNRLSRRLMRVAHAMDGEDVSPPIPPKYGDLRLHVDTQELETAKQVWQWQRDAQKRVAEYRLGNPTSLVPLVEVEEEEEKEEKNGDGDVEMKQDAEKEKSDTDEKEKSGDSSDGDEDSKDEESEEKEKSDEEDSEEKEEKESDDAMETDKTSTEEEKPVEAPATLVELPVGPQVDAEAKEKVEDAPSEEPKKDQDSTAVAETTEAKKEEKEITAESSETKKEEGTAPEKSDSSEKEAKVEEDAAEPSDAKKVEAETAQEDKSKPPEEPTTETKESVEEDVEMKDQEETTKDNNDEKAKETDQDDSKEKSKDQDVEMEDATAENAKKEKVASDSDSEDLFGDDDKEEKDNAAKQEDVKPSPTAEKPTPADEVKQADTEKPAEEKASKEASDSDSDMFGSDKEEKEAEQKNETKDKEPEPASTDNQDPADKKGSDDDVVKASEEKAPASETPPGDSEEKVADQPAGATENDTSQEKEATGESPELEKNLKEEPKETEATEETKEETPAKVEDKEMEEAAEAKPEEDKAEDSKETDPSTVEDDAGAPVDNKEPEDTTDKSSKEGGDKMDVDEEQPVVKAEADKATPTPAPSDTVESNQAAASDPNIPEVKPDGMASTPVKAEKEGDAAKASPEDKGTPAESPLKPVIELPPPRELSQLEKDYEVLKDYVDAYEREIDPLTGEVSFRILDDEEREEDYVAINRGVGVGASNRHMNLNEKEVEFQRWQTALLSSMPEAPTFEEIGMKNCVFMLEERRKQLRLKREREEAKDGSNKRQKTDSPQKPRNIGAVERKSPGKKAKEEEEKNEGKVVTQRMKALPLVPYPSFFESDLRRVRIVHFDLMTTSIQFGVKQRLDLAQEEYNTSFKTSNQLFDRKQTVENQLKQIVHTFRERYEKMKSDYQLKMRSEFKAWRQRKAEHDAYRLKKLLPSKWNQQPVGTQITQAVCNKYREGSVPHIVGTCVADITDAALQKLTSNVQDEPFEPFHPAPAPDLNSVIADQNTGETAGQQLRRLQAHYQQEIQAVSLKLNVAEDERKRAWKKLLKTKGEYETASHASSLVGAGGHYTPARRGLVQGFAPTGNMNARDQRYSASARRDRVAADGSIEPPTKRKGSDGLFLRPAGRGRKGMDWDAVRGVWIPQ